MSGGLDVVLPRPGINASLRVNHRNLAHVAGFVSGEQSFQSIGRAATCAHQRESERPIRRIDKGLRRHRADARFSPSHNRTD